VRSPRSCRTTSCRYELFPAPVGFSRGGNGKKCVRAGLSALISKKGEDGMRRVSAFGLHSWVGSIASPGRWGRGLPHAPGGTTSREGQGRCVLGGFRLSPWVLSEQDKRNKTSSKNVFFINGVNLQCYADNLEGSLNTKFSCLRLVFVEAVCVPLKIPGS